MTDHWPDLPEPDAGDALHDIHHHDPGLHDLGHDLAAEHGVWHPEPAEHLLPEEVALHLGDVHHEADLTAVDRAVLADVYGVEPAALDAAAERLGLPEDVDGYGAAVLLGEVGVDAAALHGDVDSLAAELADGHEVVVNGPTGRLTVLAVDDAAIVLQDPAGVVTQVELPAFEAVWAEASYAMVVAEPATPAGEIVLDTGPVTVLGMSWPPQV